MVRCDDVDRLEEFSAERLAVETGGCGGGSDEDGVRVLLEEYSVGLRRGAMAFVDENDSRLWIEFRPSNEGLDAGDLHRRRRVVAIVIATDHPDVLDSLSGELVDTLVEKLANVRDE